MRDKQVSLVVDIIVGFLQVSIVLTATVGIFCAVVWMVG